VYKRQAIGSTRWGIAKQYGGEGADPLQLHLRYEALASASLTVALVQTQFDAAADMIESLGSESLCQRILPAIARQQTAATVGIAQLTTSRQTGAPSLRARKTPEGWLVNGEIPWATAASHADFIVAGAVTLEGRQVLLLMPTDLPGVDVGCPLPLVALASSHTTSVQCKDVLVPAEYLLAGPAAQVLGRRKRSLPIGQAFLALGLCRGALDLMDRHDSELARDARRRFENRLAPLRDTIINASTPGGRCDSARAPLLRGECNELALRVTHAIVALYKGSGLLANHPAQRLAREALFLMVWSCPAPVIDCTIDLLSAE
jgi:alkylation response protein AidB-like acyl-CoA dehydrogenase